MIQFIQQKLILPLMLKRFRSNRPGKAFVPIVQAGEIGILADLRKPDHKQPLIQFTQVLHKQNKKCHLFILVPDIRKELNRFEYEKNFPGMPVEIICADDLKGLQIPPKKLIEVFTKKRFDILFRLDTGTQFTLDYILIKTVSRMYAGPSGSCGGIMDFEIELEPGADLTYLTENLLNYLQVIQSNDKNQKETPSNKLF